MEYYSVIKNNKIMTFSRKWMELEITLREINQTLKDKHQVFSFIFRISGEKGHESRRGTIKEEEGNQGERDKGR
jgi:hypothetical protein